MSRSWLRCYSEITPHAALRLFRPCGTAVYAQSMCIRSRLVGTATCPHPTTPRYTVPLSSGRLRGEGCRV
eukprot:24487-Eustigmatos_ZCMA.PRE.1